MFPVPYVAHSPPIRSHSNQMCLRPSSGKAVQTRLCIHCRHNIVHRDILPSIYLSFHVSSALNSLIKTPLVVLCITLPKASRTAWDVKFSEGIKLIKCFCRFFSCIPMCQRALSSCCYKCILLFKTMAYLLQYIIYSRICFLQISR